MKGRIAFVLPAIRTGGVESHTLTLANGTASAGYKVDLFSTYFHPDIHIPPHLQATRGSLAKDLLFFLGKTQPALILVAKQLGLISVTATLLLTRKRPKLVAVIHTMPSRKHGPINRARRHLQLLCYRNMDVVVFPSEFQRLAWHGAGLRTYSSCVIPNGVDIEKFSPAVRIANRGSQRSLLKFDEGDVVFGTVARLEETKRIHLQIEAIRELRASGISAKLMIVGGGRLNRTLHDCASQCGVVEHVRFLGERFDIPALASALDVGLLTSRSEVMPLFALECMAMGIPVILPRVGGTPEILTDSRCGLLFEGDRVEALLPAMLDLLPPHRREAAGSSARSRVVEHFSQGAMNEAYLQLFETLMSSGAGN